MENERRIIDQTLDDDQERLRTEIQQFTACKPETLAYIALCIPEIQDAVLEDFTIDQDVRREILAINPNVPEALGILTEIARMVECLIDERR